MTHKLGTKIRVLRQGAGMTQEQLAKELGCSGSFISHVEAGNRTPTQQDVVRICEIFKVRPEELTGDQYELSVHFRNEISANSAEEMAKNDAINDFLAKAQKKLSEDK